ncbi:DEAD/DEAH box helicase [Allonocardiopsis opalescens]|uniref:RNA helicase n=1 Tax=Allonocardiopsis opalescens TaxID=1144618 RepID=A0A2T0QDN1_9ACTN|nr:DEAD/DEAH box helicase [Allonocardiopsis opalescens]PRY01980.1 superfamily II DNA/RNA helicase [Allonocardiopsis opalescens]
MEAVVLTTFRELGVQADIADALEAEGIVEPFPIQTLALPLALGGNDIIGQARTGTGKTYAFGLALVQRVADAQQRLPRALVVVPTRELAIQVTADLTTAAKRTSVRVLTVYGGRAYEPQISALRAGVDIVVGTPGRLLDLVGQKHLDLSVVESLVLDEADKMLDLGFLPDVERILTLTPADRQVMLFSATMPSEIVTLSRRYLRQPTHVRADGGTDEPTLSASVRHHVFRTHPLDKPEMLARLLQAEGRGLTMVFCQTKRVCDQVVLALTGRGFAAAAVHGDLGQSQRERALRAFRSGKIDVLVATDVAARGLDVDDVTHVVNYECPEDDKTYVHRVGRTGRAGRSGTAVTFIDWQETQRWKLINNALKLAFAEPEETYSTSEHFRLALDIPADATGVLAADRRDRAGLEAEMIEDIGDTGRAGRRDRDRDRDRDRGERSSKSRSTRQRRRTRRSSNNAEPRTADAAQPAAPSDKPTGQAQAEGSEPAQRRRSRSRRRLRSGVDVAPADQSAGDGDTASS